jgi:uncharacterized protein YjbI with pentapeptide repeats
MKNEVGFSYSQLAEKHQLNPQPQKSDLQKVISLLTPVADPNPDIYYNDTVIHVKDIYEEEVNMDQSEFYNLTLTNLNFSCFNFSNCYLENVVFEDSVFVRSVFDGTQFRNCKFLNCDMTYAHLINCSLSDTVFKNAAFHQAYIKRLELNQCDFNKVIFSGLLCQTDFTTCTLHDLTLLCEMSGLAFPDQFQKEYFG